MSPNCQPFSNSFKMASQFFRKVYSLFYQQPTKKKEEPYSFRTINGVFRNWAKTPVEDLPPQYAYSPESKAHFQDEIHSPPPPFASPRLQICPHETVSFEKLERTAKDLAIRNTGETVDALTLSCHEHRSQIDPTANKTKHTCISSPSLLRGFGDFASEGSKDPSHTPSIVLYFHWDLGFLEGVRSQVETAADLQQFLGVDSIWLCPHKHISDSDIVNAIYGFLKRSPGREITTGCDRCDSEIKVFARREGHDEACRVTTKRYLGTVDRANDPKWLAQCGV